METFHRQLAARFIFARPDFEIVVEDTRDPAQNPPGKVEPLSVPVNEETRIDLSTRPVITDSGKSLPVKGWLAMAKDPYKYEEMAGVRIYTRNKIAAMTRDFEQPAGFTGEFTIRSYLVGEVYAEWLDLDEDDDLIRSDRQGILWESDYGRALRKWGAQLIKEIGKASSKPRRERTRKNFLEKSNFVERARTRYAQKEVADAAIDLAGQIGSYAAEDELENEDYLSELTNVILAIAPHKALIQAFQDFATRVSEGDVSTDSLLDLFSKARIAEMASYSQVAAERVRVIRELERLVFNDAVSENEFQKLLADAPWLIEPTWSVISKNQSLKSFKQGFEYFWKQKTGQEVTLSISFESKRPDFTLVSIGQMLHIVEIKTSGHTFDDIDFERLINYVYAFEEFFKANQFLAAEFSKGWRIELVTDGIELRKLPNRTSFESFEERGQVKRISWQDFLTRAKNAHEMFLDISERASGWGLSLSES